MPPVPSPVTDLESECPPVPPTPVPVADLESEYPPWPPTPACTEADVLQASSFASQRTMLGLACSRALRYCTSGGILVCSSVGASYGLRRS